MSLISGSSVTGSGAADTGYQISRSLRFNSADSAYLNRTPASAGNRKTWTFSMWVKRGSMGASRNLFSGPSGTPFFYAEFNSSDSLEIGQTGGSSAGWSTAAKFRDPSAWYHIVIVLDTTSATTTMLGTATDRLRLYVNGTQYVMTGGTVPTLNADLQINNNTAQYIGSQYNSGAYQNGYMTEINFIDGQALTPTDFGEFNTDTGVWQPIEYTGTYGTNGFYLDFADNTSTTTLGYDAAGSNDWTTNNFSVTAGAGNDSLVDSPTRYGTDTGAGGEVRGNYCTWNRLQTSSSITLANGNLDGSITGGLIYSGAGTIQVTTGKWYFETVVTAAFGAYPFVGVVDLTQVTSGINTSFYSSTGSGNTSGIIAHATNTNVYLSNNTSTTDGTSYNGTSDVLMVAFDADLGKVWFGKNGTWNNSTNPATNTGGHTFSTVSGNGYRPYVQCNADTANSWTSNFGARPFSYTAPSGFKALVTTNLPTPTIEDGGEYFNTVLYSGNNTTQSITGVGFQPDWVWIKSRNSTYSNLVWDVIRTASNVLVTDSTQAEVSYAGFTSFNSDGFSVSTNGGATGATNDGTTTYAAWNWKANGAGVSNTAGTITSTVSVNTTSGFSIVTYTGTGSAGTVGHGLGAVPRMIIVKNRDAADAWQVYHAANTANPETDYLVLNTTAATADAADRWNDTLPTSTVFSIGNGVEVNTNTEDYVAYVFAQIAGYSAFGSYTGNGSADGPFIYTGFRPAFVMIKQTNTSGNDWVIRDNRRAANYNVINADLFPNTSGAETSDSFRLTDFVSNGFKIRNTGSGSNTSGSTYIYMAFAENPFAYSLAR